MAILSDAKTALLLADRKGIRRKQLTVLKRPGRETNRGSTERRLLVTSDSGRTFTIIVNRKSNPRYFSVILAFTWYGKAINLIRCDMHHRDHTNQLERLGRVGVSHIPGGVPHIHRATERYQRAGQEPEAYAEPTNHFANCNGAIEFLCTNYGFYLSDDTYPTLHPLLGE